MGPMQQCSLGPILPPAPCFSTLCLKLPVKHQKNIITWKVLVTQTSNIVLLHWHTLKPICAYFQAFLNTFSLLKLTFFKFFSGGVMQTAKKFNILLILTEKNALKWLEWCIFRVEACHIKWHWF